MVFYSFGSRPRLAANARPVRGENVLALADPRLPLSLLAAAAVAFLVIELLSLLIGVRLTRTMTRAVADLYEGTQRVHAADFSWRIPVRSRDQLASLADSFNTMTASIKQLIEEQKEKQRLQFELDVARDVQAQLFPKEVPALKQAPVFPPAAAVPALRPGRAGRPGTASRFCRSGSRTRSGRPGRTTRSGLPC